jgi:hypothetical protein
LLPVSVRHSLEIQFLARKDLKRLQRIDSPLEIKSHHAVALAANLSDDPECTMANHLQ